MEIILVFLFCFALPGGLFGFTLVRFGTALSVAWCQMVRRIPKVRSGIVSYRDIDLTSFVEELRTENQALKEQLAQRTTERNAARAALLVRTFKEYALGLVLVIVGTSSMAFGALLIHAIDTEVHTATAPLDASVSVLDASRPSTDVIVEVCDWPQPFVLKLSNVELTPHAPTMRGLMMSKLIIHFE